jgi:crotonobetainyl-CoA:carnitine CoA-transferase CaiB-like acyl-CoA transferase
VSGALDGVLVADFSRVLAGPYATMLLADLGADVVKVERPGVGDDTRDWGPPYADDGQATYFLSVNRNKRSVVLDLRSDEGRELALELIRRADVVIENFSPGVMDTLGLGWDVVHAENPRAVYASITGFGRAAGRLPGYDLLVQAVGGLMSVTGTAPDDGRAGEPTKVGVALVDVITGLHAAVGILAAVRHREQTGEGQHVEVELMTSLLAALVNQSSAYVSAGVVPTPAGNRHPSIAPYETFPTADRQIALACGNDKQFRALCIALDLLSLPDEPRFSTNPSRVEHADDLRAILSIAFARAGADHWHEVLTKVGVPCGPINDIDAAFAFAASLGIPAIVDVPTPEGGTLRQVADPITLSATPPTYRSAPPRLGADTDEVVAWLRRRP